jgi:hypothetical protein
MEVFRGFLQQALCWKTSYNSVGTTIFYDKFRLFAAGSIGTLQVLLACHFEASAGHSVLDGQWSPPHGPRGKLQNQDAISDLVNPETLWKPHKAMKAKGAF